MAKFDVDVQSKPVADLLGKIKAQGGNMKPAYQSIGRKVVSRIRFGFSASTGPNGERWAPLKFRIGQPLRDTGLLQNSITANATDQYVDVGTNKVQARLQQFGGIVLPLQAKRLVFRSPATGGFIFAKKVTIPARPFMPLDKSGNIDLPPALQNDVLVVLRGHLLSKKGTV